MCLRRVTHPRKQVDHTSHSIDGETEGQRKQVTWSELGAGGGRKEEMNMVVAE